MLNTKEIVSMRQSRLPARFRRAMTLVLSAFLILLMLVMIGVSLDVGYVVLVRTQMQSAADRGALAAAANLDRQPDAIVSEATKYAAPAGDGAKGATLKSDVEF